MLRMPIGLVLAGWLSLVLGCHQPRGDTIDRLLIGEVMTRSQFAANLRALAMPGGRLAGTPNAQRAERFVADKLREYDLENVHFEPFHMTSWIVRRTEATLLTQPPRQIEGAVALGMTTTTPPGGITAELIDLKQPQAEDFAARADALPGKFVLVRDGGLRRSEKLALALERGAAGLVVMSAADRSPVIGNGHHTPRPEPAIVIPHDQDLIDRLAAGERLSLKIELDTNVWECDPNNVVGEIPGHGPLANEVVILSAHLDSWHLAEGAMDNGSGAATILETARALAAADWRPRRTLRFIWFMSEEIGLKGSRAYVERHQEEMDNIVAVINVDMPGAPRRLVTFGHPELADFLTDTISNLAAYELEQQLSDSKGMWSDHAYFRRAGVCTLILGGELGPGVKYYHTTGDTYETVDRRGTVQSSAVLAVLMRRLADAPTRPTARLAPEVEDE